MTDHAISLSIGARIRFLRLRANLSYADLASRSHLTEPTIRNLEAGRGKGIPSLRTCMRIAEGLGVTLFDVLCVVDRQDFRRVA